MKLKLEAQEDVYDGEKTEVFKFNNYYSPTLTLKKTIRRYWEKG